MDLLSGSSNTPDSMFVDADANVDQTAAANVPPQQSTSFADAGNGMLPINRFATQMPTTSNPMFTGAVSDIKRGRGRPRKKGDILGLGMYVFYISIGIWVELIVSSGRISICIWLLYETHTIG